MIICTYAGHMMQKLSGIKEANSLFMEQRLRGFPGIVFHKMQQVLAMMEESR